MISSSLLDQLLTIILESQTKVQSLDNSQKVPREFGEEKKKQLNIIYGYASDFNDVNELAEIIFLIFPLAS